MRVRIALLSLSAVLASATVATAQTAPSAPDSIALGEWKFRPLLEVRSRGEYRRDAPNVGGFDVLGNAGPRVRNAWLLFERSRLGVHAERGGLRAQVTLQDTHGWGNPVGAGAFDAAEAYVELATSASRPALLRVGRQHVTWGEGRLVGEADWSPYARSLDAVRGALPIGPIDFEALAALLDPPAPSSAYFGSTFGEPSTGTQLYGLHASWPFDPLFRVEASGLARIARSGGGDDRFSVAARDGETYVASLFAGGEGRGWRWGAEGAYEFGRAVPLGPDGVTRSAWAAAGHVGKTLDGVLLTPTVTISGSYASGDDGTGGAYRQFDPLLPDVHTQHGAMDLFAWSNLMDAGGSVEIVPVRDTTASVGYRYARLAEGHGEWLDAYLHPVGRPNHDGEQELGHELDATLGWRPWDELDLRAGYSGLLLGDGARTMVAGQGRGALQVNGTYAPAPLAHFAFLQATLRVP